MERHFYHDFEVLCLNDEILYVMHELFHVSKTFTCFCMFYNDFTLQWVSICRKGHDDCVV